MKKSTGSWQRINRKQLTRRALLGAGAKAGVGAVGLALVGCGGDDEAPAVAEAPAPEPAAPAPEAAAPEPAAPEPAAPEAPAAPPEPEPVEATPAVLSGEEEPEAGAVGPGLRMAPEGLAKPVSVEKYWELYGKEPSGTWNPTTVAQVDAWAPVASQPYVIGAAVPHIKDPYWIGNAYGMALAASELGITVEFHASSGYGDLEDQTRVLDDLLVKQVDAIVLGAVDSAGMTPVVERSWNEGVPLVYNTVGTESPLSPTAGFDFVAAAEQQGEFYCQQYGEGKNVIVLSGPAGLEWARLAGEGIVGELEKCNTNVLDVKNHDMDLPIIQNLTEDLLTRFSGTKIDAILSYTDFGAKGIIASLRSRGFEPGEVVTSGNPLSFEALQLMEEGWFTLGQIIAPALNGKWSVYAAVHILEGNEVPAALNTPITMVTKADLPEWKPILEGVEYAPPGWLPPAFMT